MAVLLVATLGLIVAVALALWPSPEDDTDRVDPDPGGVRDAGPRVPASLEGVLTDQLISGDITRPQYRRALERIAVREERRHPLAIPWDESPGPRP